MSHHQGCGDDVCHNPHHKQSSCCDSHCTCSCHDKQSWGEELLALADEAWMELLKDNIKEQIKATAGDQLKELAKLVSETNHARWKNKMESSGNYNNFEEKLKSLFSSCESGSCKR